jgi:hypothetical protein
MKTVGIGIIGIIGIISCSGKQENKKFVTEFEVNNTEKDNVMKIEVKKVDCNILTPIHIDCIEYEHFFNNSYPKFRMYIIENRDSINLLMNIISSLQRDTFKYDFDNTPDVRVKLVIYHLNNNTDTLCMDNLCMENGRILLNGELYIFDKRLVEFIENLQ